MSGKITVGSHVQVIRDKRAGSATYRQAYYIERIVSRGPEVLAECFFADKPSNPVWLPIARLELVT
jgi:hypothetical protein